MVFTTSLSGGKGGRSALEHELRRLGITQKNGKPSHPQTQGKVERFQQTMKNWLRAQPDPARHVHAEPPAPAGRLHRHLQRPSARTGPCTGRATPGRRLRRPPQSPARRPLSRHPRPRPHRPHRQHRARHPPPQRKAPPTSASAAPTPEPASFSSSRTWTSASSTPPPANSSANSTLNPDRDYQPTGKPTRLAKEKHRGPYVGSRCPRCLATSQAQPNVESNQHLPHLPQNLPHAGDSPARGGVTEPVCGHARAWLTAVDLTLTTIGFVHFGDPLTGQPEARLQPAAKRAAADPGRVDPPASGIPASTPTAPTVAEAGGPVSRY